MFHQQSHMLTSGQASGQSSVISSVQDPLLTSDEPEERREDSTKNTASPYTSVRSHADGDVKQQSAGTQETDLSAAGTSYGNQKDLLAASSMFYDEIDDLQGEEEFLDDFDSLLCYACLQSNTKCILCPAGHIICRECIKFVTGQSLTQDEMSLTCPADSCCEEISRDVLALLEPDVPCHLLKEHVCMMKKLANQNHFQDIVEKKTCPKCQSPAVLEEGNFFYQCVENFHAASDMKSSSTEGESEVDSEIEENLPEMSMEQKRAKEGPKLKIFEAYGRSVKFRTGTKKFRGRRKLGVEVSNTTNQTSPTPASCSIEEEKSPILQLLFGSDPDDFLSLPAAWRKIPRKFGYRVTTIGIDTPEAHIVKSLLKEGSLEPTVIKRIQNSTVWKQYTLARSELLRKLPLSELNECFLLYQGKKVELRAISQLGFNNRQIFPGPSGKGYYLSKEAQIRSNSEMIIVAQVLCGNSVLGSKGFCAPPIKTPGTRFQTCVDSLDSPTKYVVFDSTLVYPAYSVFFN